MKYVRDSVRFVAASLVLAILFIGCEALAQAVERTQDFAGFSSEHLLVAGLSIVITALVVEALKKAFPSVRRKGSWRNKLLWAVAVVAALLVLIVKAWVLELPMRGGEAWDYYMGCVPLGLEAGGARAALRAMFRREVGGS